jgi:hypothetical protein
VTDPLFIRHNELGWWNGNTFVRARAQATQYGDLRAVAMAKVKIRVALGAGVAEATTIWAVDGDGNARPL